MKKRVIKSTEEKVLELNLDQSIYGTFGEIGAGQEVANWFFRVSASAGTVAKTISAYDMTMSDAIYGKASRYVSRARLRAMLDHEYEILQTRLGPERGDRSTFFSFCNTVRARGYQDAGECHGWMGIRFQLTPDGEPNDILVHVRLLDDENVDQMEALGILGVNLIHAAFYHRMHLERFVESLVDGLSPWQVEVDMLKFFGPSFAAVDNRLCSLQLVTSGLTPAAMFLPSGEVVQPAEALYSKPVLLLRGSFNPILKLHLDMLKQARTLFHQGMPEEMQEKSIELCELTMSNLLRNDGGLDHLDFLDRVDALQALGKHVMISNSPEFYRVVAIIKRHTRCPVGVILSIGLLNELFKAKWSKHLDGGTLESFGRLLKEEVSLLVYPWKNRKTEEMVTAGSFQAPEDFEHLYRHFLKNQQVREVPCGDERLLRYTSRDIDTLREQGDGGWEEFVA